MDDIDLSCVSNTLIISQNSDITDFNVDDIDLFYVSNTPSNRVSTASFTILFYKPYQCTLTLLARRSGSTCSRLVFYIFPWIKSFQKFRHCRSTKSNDLSDFCFFLIHPDVAVIPAVFSHGSSLLFF